MTSSVPQCCKNLWVSLTGTSLLKSKEYIGSILQTNAPKLINGLLYYKNCKVKDVAEVKQILTANEIDEISPEFLFKLSTLIDVEPLQSFELFLSFLLHEYKGTPKSIKNYFNSEKSIQSLLNSLLNYYYSERLFALFSLKLILSNWQKTSDHPYQQLFEDFLSADNVKSTILKQLLLQFKSSLSCEYPSRGSMSEEMYDKLLEHNVKEQMEILQLLLLYFNDIEPSMDNLLELMDLFRSHGFGARPLCDRRLNLSKNSNIESYLKFNGFLESAIIVECLRIDSLCKCMEEESNDHLLLVVPSKLKQLDELIQSQPASLQPSSVLFLSWTIVRSFALPELISSPALIKQMGTTSLNLKIFDYIQNSLTSTFFENIKETAVECVLKRVLANLLSSVFTVFSLSLTSNYIDSVYEVSKILMNDETVAHQVLDRSSDNGLYELFQKSYEDFPYSITRFLELSLSLIQRNNCDAVVNELCSINCFNEWIDVQELNLTPTENQGILTLKADKHLYNDRNLVILKDTHATLKNRRNETTTFFVQWRNVSINGFLVLNHLFEEKLRLIKSGQYSSITEEAIEELCLITDMVTKLLENDTNNYKHVSSIIHRCFEAFRLFTRFPQIPRKLLVSFLELFSLLSSSENHSTTIWEMIFERGFFPYQVGLTKDKTAIINGQDTNASKIGEIIAFEECVVGEYQLCSAYLKFLCNSCATKSNLLLPALIHVLTEIFPSFYRWHYKRNSDFGNIGHLCLQLFQNILCLNEENDTFKEIVEVCKNSLLNNASGQTLLELIISGETVVKEVVEASGSDIALMDHNLIVMVRQSLSVLNRLLFLQEKEKNEKFVASAVEQSLFSTTTTRPNMVLVLSHFVFQNYDTRSATLAAMLMKRLSKHFPMSLLACLGSEAESVKAHFLFKLEAVTEDLRLKVSLLNFLSSCIKHQPGLIEMFLNIDSSNDTSNETSSCLKTVLEILDEKMTEKYFCPPELHCAAVRFLYTFWLQSHLLAINSLKKTAELWKLICFPITGEKRRFDDKICGYIWRILAREVFFIKVLDRGEFDPSFVKLLTTLKDEKCLEKMSTQVFQCCSQQVDNTVDSCFLLASWRDFLLSFSKFSPFEISDDTKQKIVADIVTSLRAQLSFKEKPNHSILLNLSDMLIFILKKWNKSGIRSLDDWIRIKTEILYLAQEQKEVLTIGFHISLNTLMSLTFQIYSESGLLTREKLRDCFLPWCGLFNYSLRILEKQMSSGKYDNELKLLMSSIASFQHLFDVLPDVMVLTPLFRSNLVVESMASLLCTLIRNDTGFHLAEAIISTFVLMSSTTAMADVLQLTKVLEDISSTLQNSYKMNPKIAHSDFSWLNLFRLTLKLIMSMLFTLRHHYADVAVSFVLTHLHVFENCLVEVRKNPSVEAVKIANDILSFLCILVDFRVVWIAKHKASFDKLSTEISKTCHSVIAFLIRPNLLQYVLTNPSSTRNLTSAAASQLSIAVPSKNETVEQQGNKLLKRSVSLDNESQGELNPDIQVLFLQLLAFTLKYLQTVNPSTCGVNSRENTQTTTLQLNSSFSAPNIDPDNETSFGSLLYCLSFCVRFIQKLEKECSGEVSNDGNIMKNRLPYILETSLSLVVTNAILAQNCQSLKERERQMIRRELKNELHSILSSRQPKRNVSGSNIVSAPRSPANTLLDRPFVRHLIETMEKN